MYRFVPLSTKPSPSRSALIDSEAASDPESGSVRAKEPTTSPAASLGSHADFCSSVPSMRIPCDPMPLLVPIRLRNAGEVLPSSKATSISSSAVIPRPPYCSGIVMPKRPIVRILSAMSGGMASVSATSASRGISSSATKRRTVARIESRVSWSLIIQAVSRGRGACAELRRCDLVECRDGCRDREVERELGPTVGPGIHDLAAHAACEVAGNR